MPLDKTQTHAREPRVRRITVQPQQSVSHSLLLLLFGLLLLVVTRASSLFDARTIPQSLSSISPNPTPKTTYSRLPPLRNTKQSLHFQSAHKLNHKITPAEFKTYKLILTESEQEIQHEKQAFLAGLEISGLSEECMAHILIAEKCIGEAQETASNTFNDFANIHYKFAYELAIQDKQFDVANFLSALMVDNRPENTRACLSDDEMCDPRESKLYL